MHYHRGTRLSAIKRFGLCSLCSHLNVLTFFPLTGGCSEGLHAFRFFFKLTVGSGVSETGMCGWFGSSLETFLSIKLLAGTGRSLNAGCKRLEKSRETVDLTEKYKNWIGSTILNPN